MHLRDRRAGHRFLAEGFEHRLDGLAKRLLDARGIRYASVDVEGNAAARTALGMGADVTVLDRSLAVLRHLDDVYRGHLKTIHATRDAIERHVLQADLVIGAVLIPGAAAPKLVSRAMLNAMKPGAVIVDVAIDQGGCFETSRPTTHADPTYVVDGVVHYCVANMPGAVPITSAHALNNATLVHGLALADRGLRAIAEDRHLRNGLNVHKGRITNKPVADALGYPAHAPEAVLNVA